MKIPYEVSKMFKNGLCSFLAQRVAQKLEAKVALLYRNYFDDRDVYDVNDLLPLWTHCVVVLPGDSHYLDIDGVSEESTLLQRWRWSEVYLLSEEEQEIFFSQHQNWTRLQDRPELCELWADKLVAVVKERFVGCEIKF